MLVLFEMAAGYAIYELHDEKKLKEVDNLYKDFETPELASNVLKLKKFVKFKDTTEALAAAASAIEGKMSKTLKKLLKKVAAETHEQLAVADAKLGNAIKDKLNLNCVSSSSIQELMRCIRSQATSLIPGLQEKEMSAMALGLAHSLGRYKLKFSPDKVDTMIVQAISVLDDADKELNNYCMRARELYGWHFPELGKIITDNLAYVKTVKLVGYRTNATSCDLSMILPEDVEKEVKENAEISMGTEITDDDLTNIQHLCTQVISYTEHRASLYDYIKHRMMAVAPNLTVLVGELVGARLMAHAGSLLNLAKHPASTVQILGAEKALFRALKTKHDTPKYGLIYHASLVGQSNPKTKGKISRMLAAKVSLSVRVDALGEDGNTTMGIEHLAKLQRNLKSMEEGASRKISGSGKAKAKWDKYENKSEVKTYNVTVDSTLPKKRKQEEEATSSTPADEPKRKKSKKDDSLIEEIKMEKLDLDSSQTEAKSEKKSKKSRKSEASTPSTSAADVSTSEANVTTADSEKKKKKKKKKEDEGGED